ncbi:MAG: metallophosphoesterase [Nannocystaceae bacterium]
MGAFARINERAKEGVLEIYLLNAHERRVHRAQLVKIHWKDDLEPFTSPFPWFTPGYYRGRRCRAWFELAKVEREEMSFDPLDELVQVSVPEFFGGVDPPEFARLDGVRLGGADMLDEQNRTIWFVRRPRKGEEVRTMKEFIGTGSRRRTSPVSAHEDPSFSRDYFLTRGRRLLWLSDLHFAKGPQRDVHGFAYQGEDTAYQFNLHQEIERVLDDHKVLLDVEGVLISGDITWKADPEEFREARTFIRELIAKTGKTDQAARVALCPGNHDVRFSDEPWLKGHPIDVASGPARESFSTFYQTLFEIEPNDHLSMGRRFLLGGAVPVEIVCLNSSVLQQEEGVFQGHGFIGEDQLRHAAREAGWESNRDPGAIDSPRAVRIAMVHHHLLPVIHQLVPERGGGHGYSTPLDAERLATWIVEHRVDLVLHGHMHEPFCVELHRGIAVDSPRDTWHTFTVVGLGSTGVSREHRLSGTPNLAATLEFNSKSVKVEMFEIVASGPVRRKHAQFEVPIQRKV